MFPASLKHHAMYWSRIEREIVQQLDVNAEGVKNDENGYKNDAFFDYLPVTVLHLMFFLL